MSPAFCVRDGGVLVLDVLGPRQPESARHEIAGIVYAVTRNVSESSLEEEWTVGDKLFRTTQRIYSGAELEAMLLDAGFARVALAASLDGTAPHDSAARRLVAFAWR